MIQPFTISAIKLMIILAILQNHIQQIKV